MKQRRAITLQVAIEESAILLCNIGKKKIQFGSNIINSHFEAIMWENVCITVFLQSKYLL